MQHRRTSVVRTLFAAVMAVVLMPASASAIQVQVTKAAPTDDDAAVHSAFELAVSFPEGVARDLRIGLPPGLVGDPGVTKCPAAAFHADPSTCPAASQVGSTTVEADVAGSLPVVGPLAPIPLPGLTLTGKVYNLEPQPTEPARLGISLNDGLIKTESSVRVRLDDYGLDSTMSFPPLSFTGQNARVKTVGLTLFAKTSDGRAFETNPTSCREAVTRVSVVGADESTATGSASFTPDACDKVPFDPTLVVGPKEPPADTVGHAEATLIVPGNDTRIDGKDRRQAHVDAVRLVLPEGLVLSPGLANGLEPCTEEQFGLKEDRTPSCPPSSEIGEVEFATPVFPTPLKGKVYLGQPKPPQKLRNFVSVEDPRLRVKLIGDVYTDPTTGRVTNLFPSSPQVPFTAFRFMYKGGDNAVLTSPVECNEHTVFVEMTPWSTGDAGKKVPTDTFRTVDCPPPAFTPSVAASVSDTTAGADTSLTMRFVRPDRQSRLANMKVSLPPGLAGRLGAVPACPVLDARLAACPDASQVGTAKVAVGTGNAPLTLPGRVYLTDALNGGIAGLAIVVPAKAGGLDFGTVATLAAIKLRPDAGIDVETEPLPQIVDGIVITYRSIDLTMDKPGFLRNATSCAARAFHVEFTATKGETAAAETGYQPTGCEGRPYAPRLAMTIGGRGNTGRGANPALRAVLTQQETELNSRKVAVTLPLGVSASLPNLNKAACPEAQVLAGTCPAAARIGTVRAITPLLPFPLTGEVVLQVPAKPGLPQLSIALPQVGIRLLASTAFVDGSRLQTTFDNIPDVPLTTFELSLKGGLGGVLQTTDELCGTRPTATSAFESHGGKTLTATTPVTIDGCARTAARRLAVAGSLRGRTLRLIVRSPEALRSLRIRGVGRAQRPRTARALRKAAKVKAGGRAVRKARVALRDGAIVLTGWSRGGTRRVDLTLKLRKGVRRGRRLTLVLQGTPLKGAALKATKRIAPSRRADR